MAGVRSTFTGDTQDLERKASRAKRTLADTGEAAKGLDRQLKATGSGFDGSKIEGAAIRAAKGIERIGGVAKLTDTEIARVKRTLDEAIAKAEQMGRTAPTAIRSLANEIEGLERKANLKNVLNPMGTLETLANKVGISVTQGIGIAAVGAFGALGATVGAAVKRTIEHGGAVSDLALKYGLTAEAVQDLTFAASQNGNTIEQIGVVVQRLSRHLVEGSKDFRDGVASLKLDFNELRQLSPDEALTRIGAAIAQVPDPMTRTSLAVRLLGKSGAEVLPTLVSDLEGTRRKAHELGIVMGSDLVNACDELGDAWDRIMQSGQGLLTRTVAPLIPKLLEVATIMERIAGAKHPGDTIAFHLDDVGRRMWQTAQNEWDTSPWWRKPGVGLGVGPMQLAGRALRMSASAFGSPLQGWNPLAPMPGLEPIEFQPAVSTLAPEDPRAGGGKTSPVGQFYDEAFGAKTLTNARALITALDKGFGKGQPVNQKSLAGYIQTLTDARKMATAKRDVEAIDRTLRRLNADLVVQNRSRMTSLMLPVGGGVSDYSDRYAGQTLRSSTPLTAILGPGAPSITSNFGTVQRQLQDQAAREQSRKAAEITQSMQGLASTIGTLSQITGGSLDGVSSAIGVAGAAAGIGSQLVALIPAFQATDKDGKVIGQTGLGRKVAAGIGGGLAGFNMGLLVGSESRVGGVLMGAGAGAAAGASAGWVGAGIGAVAGGIGGYFGARKAEKELRKQRDLQASQIESEYGGLDHILNTLARFDRFKTQGQQEAWLKLWYGEPKEFAKAVTELNNELVKEKKNVDELNKAYARVAETRGLLSKQELASIVAQSKGGPGVEASFQFLQGQTSSLASGLQQWLDAGKFGAGAATSGSAALGAIFALRREQGASTAEVLRELEPLITQYGAAIEQAGRGSGAFYVQAQDMLGILQNADLEPFVTSANAANQVISAMVNTGYASRESLEGFASSITDAYQALEGAGKGPQALELLQPELQNLWELSDRFGLKLDEQTQGLIDFAVESGKVGPAFMDATDRMARAVDALVGRLDTLIDRWSTLAGISGGIGRDITTPTLSDALPPPAVRPTVPAFAEGGIVTRPMVGLVGEAGPEAIIPLSRMGGHDAREQTILVQLGREVLLRAHVEGMPDYLAVRGLV